MAYSPTRTGNPAVDRNLGELKRALDDQERARLGAVRLAVKRMVGTGAIPAGSQLVVYAGDGGHVLTLPSASAQGPGVGQLLLVGNRGGGSITVLAAGTDTVNGAASISVSASDLVTLASDGEATWLS